MYHKSDYASILKLFPDNIFALIQYLNINTFFYSTIYVLLTRQKSQH